jgi:putative ABC transport system permease protein
MFARLLWKLLRGSGGRLTVALIAVVSGAAVISALLNLEFDIGSKLTQEFRELGANLVISRGDDGTPGFSNQTQQNLAGSSLLIDEQTVLSAVVGTRTPAVLAAAPYLYVVARAQDRPVVVTGTWLDQTRTLDPTWRISGARIDSREEISQCLVGRNVAQLLQLSPGGHIDLTYGRQTAGLRVAGVIESGGSEDNQVFVNLPVAQQLTGLAGRIAMVQLSVSGTTAAISEYAAQLAGRVPGYEVRPIPQVSDAEGSLLSRTRLLIVSMVGLILVLTALCVLATMAALAMERRKDVGLMKALGGSISQIVGLFLAEVSVLGSVGGAAGSVAGMALAQWMGLRVFGSSISPRWEVFPMTIALMVAVALAGAMPLRMLGNVKPAVILRGE